MNNKLGSQLAKTAIAETNHPSEALTAIAEALALVCAFSVKELKADEDLFEVTLEGVRVLYRDISARASRG